MADINTVVIISNRQEFINQISSKLVLLRNLDKIKSCSIDEADTMFDGFCPNVLLLHCQNNDSKALKLIKHLRKQELYKNLPILLINENCSRETIIEAFDSGITDTIFMPIIDYELLIRVIWCLKKHEINLNIESRAEFMINLGIIQDETGVYSEKYCNEFLKTQIAQSKKYSQHACIMLVAQDKKSAEYKTRKEFISIIQNSVRLNDSIALKDDDKIYIYLQKTKLNGAYSVFERINNNLGAQNNANAGVVEVHEQEFDDIISALDNALIKAGDNTNSLIVASEFYENDKVKDGINIENLDEYQKGIDYIVDSADNVNYDTVVEQAEQAKRQEASGLDKNSIKLFNQAYERKLKVVVDPVFKKYYNTLKSKHPNYRVNSYIGTKSTFKISSKNIGAVFALEYDGIEQVTIRLIVLEDDQKRIYESETIDFTILDYRKVSLMLSELIDKFIIILKNAD